MEDSEIPRYILNSKVLPGIPFTILTVLKLGRKHLNLAQKYKIEFNYIVHNDSPELRAFLQNLRKSIHEEESS